MSRRTRLRRPSPRLLAILAGAGLASLANAALPKILDHTPRNAVAVLGAPSLDRLDAGAAGLFSVFGQANGGLKDALQMLGLAQAVDTTQPFAILMMPVNDPNAAADAPPIVALLPVSDFQAMAKALGAADPAAPMSEISMQGETFFVKPLGERYAAFSPLKQLLENFDGAPGNLALHAAAIGQAGERVASDADVFLMFDPASVQQMSNAGLNPLAGALQKPLMAAGLGAMGQGGGMPGEQLMKDATGGLLALRRSPAGMHVDLAMNYTPGGERANMLAAGASSAPLLNALPTGEFLLAYAVDLSTPGMKALINAVGGSDPAAAASQPLLALGAAIGGQSVAIYPNPAGLFGGLLARSVSFYSSPNPADFKQSFKTFVTGLNGQNAEGAQIATTYTDNAIAEGSVNADAYTLKVLATGGVGSPLAMFYGPSGGPSGHVSAGEKGVYVTTVADAKLMAKALATTPDQSVGANPLVAQAAANLPPNRAGELYIGVKPVLDQILPLMAMAGVSANYTPPADLPPLAVAFVPEGGGFAIQAFVPNEVLQAGQALGSAIQQGSANRQSEPKKPAF